MPRPASEMRMRTQAAARLAKASGESSGQFPVNPSHFNGKSP
jgi:hypothetical protein